MIKIRYFAQLREQAGKESEELPFEGKSLEKLFLTLKTNYGFSLELHQVKFAVNETYTDATYLLKPSDEVVIVPPVAGG